MIDKDGYPVLTDFGLSVMDSKWAESLVGSPEYISPEILHHYKYTKAVDWWSFGVLVYEMLTGIPPFYSDT